MNTSCLGDCLEFEDGICVKCGYQHECTDWTNGECVECGYECEHADDHECGHCIDCGDFIELYVD